MKFFATQQRAFKNKSSQLNAKKLHLDVWSFRAWILEVPKGAKCKKIYTQPQTFGAKSSLLNAKKNGFSMWWNFHAPSLETPSRAECNIFCAQPPTFMAEHTKICVQHLLELSSVLKFLWISQGKNVLDLLWIPQTTCSEAP